jgi:hypothetical protein
MAHPLLETIPFELGSPQGQAPCRLAVQAKLLKNKDL